MEVKCTLQCISLHYRGKKQKKNYEHYKGTKLTLSNWKQLTKVIHNYCNSISQLVSMPWWPIMFNVRLIFITSIVMYLVKLEYNGIVQKVSSNYKPLFLWVIPLNYTILQKKITMWYYIISTWPSAVKKYGIKMPRRKFLWKYLVDPHTSLAQTFK
jgi:hypothetical protein